MYSIQDIIDIDKHLLLSINGGDSLFADGCIGVYANSFVWLPTLLALLYLLVKNNNVKDFITIVSFAVGMLAFLYFLTAFAMQPLFEYLRALYGADSLCLFDALNEYRAGNGSLLTHATVAFAIATFFSLLIRHKVLTFSLLLWAGIVCYTGLYMAVNYPWDIFTGALTGVFCAFMVYKMYKQMLNRQRHSRRDWISDRFTKSGYEVSDVYLLLVVLYATFAAIPIISFVMAVA